MSKSGTEGLLVPYLFIYLFRSLHGFLSIISFRLLKFDFRSQNLYLLFLEQDDRLFFKNPIYTKQHTNLLQVSETVRDLFHLKMGN